jgi:hypothetical protein
MTQKLVKVISLGISFSISLVLGMTSLPTYSQNLTQNKSQICHTANAGFYISDGKGTGVLIDSLMFTGLDGYDRPDYKLMVDMERMQGKFSDINCFLHPPPP